MAELKLAVLGAGTMGAGIAEAAAVAGLEVLSIEPSTPHREKAQTRVRKSIEKGIARNKIQAVDADEILSRLDWRSDLRDAQEATFVIEAIPESEILKREVFEELGQICSPETILASNTSSISITLLGAMSKRPPQVIGMHFFNPVPIMQAVEIVMGLETAKETLAATEQLARTMGKVPLPVQDAPGFIANRVLMPLVNEAIFAVSEGIGEPEVIDQIMQLGCNHPMGPLKLADLIGLDVVLAILEVLHRDLGDPKFRPAPLLRQKVLAGHLGRKSGRGFYTYAE